MAKTSTFSEFSVLSTMVGLPLISMMQATLVRNVAFTMFSYDPEGFTGHVCGSSTWQALEALEEKSVLNIVECLRKPIYKQFVPDSVLNEIQNLVGHRNVIGHPFTGKKEWTNKAMIKFESEGRRYESRLSLVWNLHHAINDALINEGSTPLTEFYITLEMAQQLRIIWSATMQPANASSIPDNDALVNILHDARKKTIQQLHDKKLGIPAKPRARTKLELKWDALLKEDETSRD